MVTRWTQARDVLEARLRAVFEPGAFDALYPGVTPPQVFFGFPITEPPFYAAVDEIIDAAAMSGGASMGHSGIDYTIHVWLFAQHADLKEASDALLAYTDAVFGAVMADPRLCGTVDNSTAEIESAGTAADSSRRYVAAASVAVRCTVWSACPAELAGIVEESNKEISDESYSG